MQEYKAINSQEEMNEIMNYFGGFHGSLLKEIHLINRAFTDANKRLFMNYKLDAEIYFQTQYNSRGLFLLLEDIIELNLKEQDEVYDGEGIIINNYKETNEEKQRSIVFRLDSDMFKVVSRKAAYKFDENSFGSKSRLKNEIPNMEMIDAENIGSNIRLCRGCANAIEIDDNEEFAFCETCWSVTSNKRRNPTTAST